MFVDKKGIFRNILVFVLISAFILNSVPIFGINSEKKAAEIDDEVTCDDLPDEGSRKAKFTPVLTCEDDMTKTAYPMEIIVFNCTVTNEGNMVDDYTVLTTPIKGWNIIPYPERFNRIPPYTSPAPESDRVKKMTLRVVLGDLYNATVGKYTLDVTLKSKLSSNRSTLTFTIDVLLLHRIDIVPPEPQYRLPGEDVLYEFTVQNLGNGDDEYDMWVETSDYEWVAQLVDNTQEILKIQQGRVVVVPVIVYLPEEVDAGHCQITTLCGRPTSSDSLDDVTRGFVQTMVKHIYKIDVDQSNWERVKDGKPGAYTTYNFAIINRGNDLDDVVGAQGTFIESKIPEIPMKWETWIDTSDIREGGLDKDLEADIEFKIKVPPSTPVGNYEFTIDVMSDVPLKFQDEATFTTHVVPVFDAEMEVNVSTKGGKIGENVSFDALIRNIGNIRDTYSWEIESDYSSWVYIEKPRFQVDFGEIYKPEFKVGIPMDSPAGIYDFKLILSSEGDVNITFEHNFKLNVAETLDFSFVDFEKTYDAIPGGETLIKLKVENTGNADVTLSFDIFGEHWGILGQKNLFLQYRESKEVPISFKPPAGVELKGYNFEIQGGITVGADVTKTTFINVRVVEFDFAATSIYMTGDMSRDSYGIEKDETIGFYVDILNRGNQFFDSKIFGQEIKVNIYFHDDLIYSTNITYMKKEAYERINFTHAFTIPDEEELLLQTLEARIEGIKDPNPDNNMGTITVGVIGNKKEESADPEGGITGISTSDWVYIFLIILLSFVILVTSVIMIKRKYNLELLSYDAKGDYDFDKGDSFLDDDTDFDEADEEEMEMRAEKNFGYMSELERSRFGPQGQVPYGFEGGAPGQFGYPPQGFPPQQGGEFGYPPQGFPQQGGEFGYPSQGFPPQQGGEFGSDPQGAPVAPVTAPVVTTTVAQPAQTLPANTMPVENVLLPKTTPVVAGEQKALPPGTPQTQEGKEGSIDIQGVLTSIKRTAPVVAKTAPVPGGATPMVAKTAPVPGGATPVAAKTAPVVAKTGPLPAGNVTVAKTTSVPATKPVIAKTSAVPSTQTAVAKTSPFPVGSGQPPQSKPVVIRPFPGTHPKTAASSTSTQESKLSPGREDVAETTKKLEDILAKLKM